VSFTSLLVLILPTKPSKLRLRISQGTISGWAFPDKIETDIVPLPNNTPLPRDCTVVDFGDNFTLGEDLKERLAQIAAVLVEKGLDDDMILSRVWKIARDRGLAEDVYNLLARHLKAAILTHKRTHRS